MRVAFLANTFHLKMTKSSDFFIELLKRAFDDVHVISFKEAWSVIPRSKWDMLIVFMALVEPEELEAFGVPQVVLVPMTDYCPHVREYWIRYKQFKVFCLSTTLLSELRNWGLNAFGLHYYPPVQSHPNVHDQPELRGFFWPRIKQLGWSTIKSLIGDTRFDSFHLHWTRELNPDLTDLPGTEDKARFSIQTSSWFQSRDDYGETVRQTNIFFASRRAEGIGHAYLEALSWGLCVVSPNAPTMSEYIVHGVNGLLYDPDNPLPLDFSGHRALGKAARESCVLGRSEWERGFGDVKNFLEAAGSNYVMQKHPLIRAKRRSYVALRTLYRAGKGFIHLILRLLRLEN